MNEMINVIIDGVKKSYPKEVSCLDISKDYQDKFSYPIIGAILGSDIVSLEKKITEDNSNLVFLDLTTRDGNRMYEKGLIFLYTYAINELYKGKVKVRIEHSIDKGIYTSFSSAVTETMLEDIKAKIKELVDKDIRFEEMTISRSSAIAYFNSINRPDKAHSLRYLSNTYIKLYRFVSSYDYFYGVMPYSSKYITEFEIKKIDDTGVMLLYPNMYHNSTVSDYKHHDLLYKEFNEYNAWAKLLNLSNVYNLNDQICQGNSLELIIRDEAYQSYRLLELAKKIVTNEHKIKLILISGPSSSGKTTTSKKLSIFMSIHGINVKMLSLDDYFLDRDQTPKDEDGKYDYESLKAIDLDLFNKQLTSLLSKEEVLLPTYNFVEGKKEFKNKLKLEDNDILLVEGLHTLNDEVTAAIPRKNKFKIYLSPLTELNIDDYNRVSTTDARLLRRMTRDNRMRGHNASKTLEGWKSVRRGEEKYVFPYQDEADVVFNTALIYELAVIKTYIEPLLFSVDKDDPNYKEAIRLLDLLRNFVPISGEDVPKDSILREFIGNSCF